MSVQSDLKALETKRSYVVTHLESARQQLREFAERVKRLETDLRTVNRQIDQLKNGQPGLIISEHAILRYLERVKGVDMEALKVEMCGGRDPRSIDPSGGLILLPVGNSHKFRIQDGVAVTTITDDKQEK